MDRIVINGGKNMAFIGIIANSKHEIQIKRALESKLNSLNKEHTIIPINEKSINNIKNIRFETILLIDLEKVQNEISLLNEIFENSRYLVVNADMYSSLDFINNMKLNIITFGFNSKSTITASSVENNFIICLQRNLVDINCNTLEPQEIQVKIMEKKLLNNSHNIMGIASILLIYGREENFF